MLKVTKEVKGGILAVHMEGALEESVNFDQLIGLDSPAIVVECKDVSRINSVGVKSWIEFFQRCASKNIKLTFKECSPMLVQQFNTISNFRCGGQVESIMVPFSCEKCGAECQKMFTIEALRTSNYSTPSFKCPRCPGQIVFDDEPDEYFGCFKKG